MILCQGGCQPGLSNFFRLLTVQPPGKCIQSRYLPTPVHQRKGFFNLWIYKDYKRIHWECLSSYSWKRIPYILLALSPDSTFHLTQSSYKSKIQTQCQFQVITPFACSLLALVSFSLISRFQFLKPGLVSFRLNCHWSLIRLVQILVLPLLNSVSLCRLLNISHLPFLYFKMGAIIKRTLEGSSLNYPQREPVLCVGYLPFSVSLSYFCTMGASWNCNWAGHYGAFLGQNPYTHTFPLPIISKPIICRKTLAS